MSMERADVEAFQALSSQQVKALWPMTVIIKGRKYEVAGQERSVAEVVAIGYRNEDREIVFRLSRAEYPARPESQMSVKQGGTEYKVTEYTPDGAEWYIVASSSGNVN